MKWIPGLAALLGCLVAGFVSHAYEFNPMFWETALYYDGGWHNVDSAEVEAQEITNGMIFWICDTSVDWSDVDGIKVGVCEEEDWCGEDQWVDWCYWDQDRNPDDYTCVGLDAEEVCYGGCYAWNSQTWLRETSSINGFSYYAGTPIARFDYADGRTLVYTIYVKRGHYLVCD